MKINMNLVSSNDQKQKPTDVLKIPFGTEFTDHMFSMKYSEGSWNDAAIHPFSNLSLSPAALCLHYGQGIFEGMKAYRRGERTLLFRPERNFSRFNESAARMVMPEIDVDFALSALKQLLTVERDWVPEAQGSSLYIRPTMIGTQAKLGVKPSDEYLFFIILSPVGPYFKEGFNPVKIFLSTEYVRAVRGGIGAAKTMGNYAASLLAGTKAAEVGHSQVLWMDALDRKYLEEVGTMNIFVKFDDELATPPLSGSILSGITRDSVLTLTRDMGLKVSERKVSIDEVIEGIDSGKVTEIFGCGTAAIIAPVGSLWYKENSYTVSGGKIGELTQHLFDELTGIQYGERPDPYGWVVEVN
ncbi:MAG: branched-chain amino acid aminotransferase [Candidatus Thorarchaeota archaeon]|nr:MAG: branched-chain amino acid aminotransferase [Candidatus Thorarchaeota archaeon]